DTTHVDQSLPLRRGHPDLDRRPAVGPRSAGGLRRAVVPRATADRSLRGPGALGGAGRLAVDGGAAPSRAAEPARARSLRGAGGVRLRLPRGRLGRRTLGGGVSPAGFTGAPP